MKSDLEESLDRLPAEVATALLNWRKSTLDRERLEATLHLNFKAEFTDLTATDLKAKVHASQERYEAKLVEISFESVYTSLYEQLMSAKKLCDHRTAF